MISSDNEPVPRALQRIYCIRSARTLKERTADPNFLYKCIKICDQCYSQLPRAFPSQRYQEAVEEGEQAEESMVTPSETMSPEKEDSKAQFMFQKVVAGKEVEEKKSMDISEEERVDIEVRAGSRIQATFPS